MKAHLNKGNRQNSWKKIWNKVLIYAFRCVLRDNKTAILDNPCGHPIFYTLKSVTLILLSPTTER